jgi:hypothetical protein
LPRSRTPAESTIPRLFVGLVDAAPASRTAKASAPVAPLGTAVNSPMERGSDQALSGRAAAV